VLQAKLDQPELQVIMVQLELQVKPDPPVQLELLVILVQPELLEK
jgi:hypothetical protein